MSSINRITGMASGLDVDTLVKQMMKAENIKMDKLKQQKQLTQWKQDAYRDIMSSISELKSTYFDVLKSDSYVLSQNNYSLLDVASGDSKIATATCSAGAQAGTYTLSNIKIATKASYMGSTINNVIQADIPFSSLEIKEGVNDNLSVLVGGKAYNIKLTAKVYGSLNDLTTEINSKLVDVNAKLSAADIKTTVGAAVSSDGTKIVFAGNGSDSVTVTGSTVSDNSLIFKTIVDSTNRTLKIDLGGGNVYDVTIDAKTYNDGKALADAIQAQISANTNLADKVKVVMSPDNTSIQIKSLTSGYVHVEGELLQKMGYANIDFDVNMGQYTRMSSLLGGQVDFTVNGKEIKYDFNGADKNRTISDIVNDISSLAGVDMRYNELTKQFSMYSTTTGNDQEIRITSDSGGFFTTLFGGIPDGTNSKKGTNSSVTITEPNGSPVYVEKTTNTFSIDGVVYSLQGNGSTSLTMTSNVDKACDKIKAFIDKYNSIITKVQKEITEKKDKGYPPLTDDQKSAMTADQIKNWEDKAKEGILGNDMNLQSMLDSLRRAFYDAVPGTGISLSEVGLSTTDDYTNGGTINVDENKLKAALKNNGGQVMSLFTRMSSLPYDADHKTDKGRYSQEGIFQRINDIYKDYARTTRNSSGLKGILVNIAGLKGDTSELTNDLYKTLTEQNRKISNLAKKLTQDESKYYNQFSKLETMMQQLNSQQSALSSMLGSR